MFPDTASAPQAQPTVTVSSKDSIVIAEGQRFCGLCHVQISIKQQRLHLLPSLMAKLAHSSCCSFPSFVAVSSSREACILASCFVYFSVCLRATMADAHLPAHNASPVRQHRLASACRWHDLFLVLPPGAGMHGVEDVEGEGGGRTVGGPVGSTLRLVFTHPSAENRLLPIDNGNTHPALVVSTMATHPDPRNARCSQGNEDQKMWGQKIQLKIQLVIS